MWIRQLVIEFCIVGLSVIGLLIGETIVLAEGNETHVADQVRIITGVVQDENYHPVPHAKVEWRDQDGSLLEAQVTNKDGEFIFGVPAPGIYSIKASQAALSSETVVLKIGMEPLTEIQLTLALRQELTLEVLAPLPPLQHHVSSETFSVSRKDIEELPRGNNLALSDVLLTLPSATDGGLGQVHIRQEHGGLQFRIDGVPIPDTVSSVFSDILSPRIWERADIILGGPEAQYGNRTAAVLDVTTKSGSAPPFGSVQFFGGSNETINPSFEYGGTVGEAFRVYVQNSFISTNRGLNPPTLGKTIFHDQSTRNQTFLRGDWQVNNQSHMTWLFLNSIAKFQIPTRPNLTANQNLVALIQAQDPGFTPVRSQDIDENQKENNQYSQVVWRHDLSPNRFFNLAGYFRHTRSTFSTDPLNVLAYTPDSDEPFSAGSQDRFAYSGGFRFDYTHRLNPDHLLKAGMQIDRTEAINKTRLSVFLRDGMGNPTGGIESRNADNRTIGWREEFWVQDQWTPWDKWTFNLGVRFDQIQALTNDGQVSPRIGITYALTPKHVFHVFYGRLFTPPSLEAVQFVQLNTIGTTAEPENLTNRTVEPERAHYFEVGSAHSLGDSVEVELTGFYKLSKNLSDAGQFGTTPLLNYFAFERGWQRGVDFSIKAKFSEKLYGRGNVAWGQCRGKKLQSGYFLLEQGEIDDINSSSGVFCDHMQLVTSSAVLTYHPFEQTTVTGQMLFGSGLRTANPGEKTNSNNSPSHTTYNFSIDQVISLWDHYKVVLGFDVINVLDQQVFLNSGEGSIGLGVSHANLPRSFFFRGQFFFGG
ncbi:MAG: TonB-dependent receptor [Nitrospirota bacterium]|nr:TonB-dependent receptor [Nitrospirota bacterium]